ncbi:MAG: polyprenyl synthetase family protein [Chloroflexi bacterium]|nr:polyprenyl synthetase family protein [Chloroflexota bacterium]
MRQELEEVDSRLKALAAGAPPAYREMLGYVLDSRGKRLRPAIALLASKFYPLTTDRPITMAMAVELLHLASLIHDDTVDNSSLRRGLATASSLWGRDVAVLLGDYVFSLSATFVCDTGNMYVIRRLSETIRDLSQGELLELLAAFRWDQTYEQYQERIYYKTASLFRTAAEAGAVLSEAPEATVHALADYGYHLGMAFQLVDDILDFQATEEEVGKPVGNDLLQGTLTLPALLLVQSYPNDNPVIRLCRGEEREANRKRAVEVILNSTILRDSYAVAEQFCEKARAALQGLPPVPAHQSLLDLVGHVTARRR